jgi:hypothetical protein
MTQSICPPYTQYSSNGCTHYIANCRECQTKDVIFHVSISENWPLEYWDCGNCGAQFERKTHTAAQWRRENRSF